MRFTVLMGLLIFLGGCGESSPASPALTGEGGVGGPVEEGGASPDAGNRSDSPALDPCEELECDDLNSCTVDSCVDGACIHQGDKGKPCDDENACTTEDACSTEGLCVGATTVECNDDNPCTEDQCDTGSGCTFEELGDGTSCNDGDACTLVDVCVEGVCAGTAKPCEEDDTPCTVQTGCDAESGECLTQNLPDGTGCDDGDACTESDACESGVCTSSTPKVCDDGNSCTDDSCTPKNGCSFFPNTSFCDDGDFCTVDDKCAQGQCTGQELACNDNNPCTNDGCDPESGCTYQNVEGPCEDGNLCTISDLCQGGQCQNGPQKECDDDNACTDEYCDLSSGNCVFEYNESPCSDGNACTELDICANGSCLGAVPVICNDGDPCTSDGCDPDLGCTIAPASGNPCDDGNQCTEQDICQAGTCTAGPLKDCSDGNGCTDSTCNPADGSCQSVPNTKGCDDGDPCTSGDTCAEGECIGLVLESESNVCDGLDEDCDGETDEDCALVLGPGIFSDGGSPQSTTLSFELKEAVGTPRFVGTSSDGQFTIVPAIPHSGGGQP